jgi:hypothetical protein
MIKTDNRERASTSELEKRIYIREHRARILTRLWVSLIGREYIPSRQVFRQFLNSARIPAEPQLAIESLANEVSRNPSRKWDVTTATRYVARLISHSALSKEHKAA